MTTHIEIDKLLCCRKCCQAQVPVLSAEPALEDHWAVPNAIRDRIPKHEKAFIHCVCCSSLITTIELHDTAGEPGLFLYKRQGDVEPA